MASLLDPIQIGEIKLPNRLIMSPLTRLRATPDHVPTQLMAEYYKQRSSAGLIISEGIPVVPQGVGYANVPGIWSPLQTEAWKLVTEAVHGAGGRIFAQIWHVGRISDPRFLDGNLPVAPSAIQPAGHVSLVRPITDYVTPRALQISEIPGVVEGFRKGAENAELAGFDGVEIHGANGYLLDQFLQGGSNHRTDEYGGSIENRARLMLEVADAVISVWGPSEWACIWRHAAIATTCMIQTLPLPLATWRVSSVNAGLPLCARANSSDLTDWVPSSRSSSAASILQTKDILAHWLNRSYGMAKPMRWPLANYLSPTPICRHALRAICRSTLQTPAPSLPRGHVAIPTILQ